VHSCRATHAACPAEAMPFCTLQTLILCAACSMLHAPCAMQAHIMPGIVTVLYEPLCAAEGMGALVLHA
jgi:hypothetical protein